ncbi:hypothetical protein NL341_26505, partial [Klebsiella pneumoniae]|nr:hypothetical protein [Klebsiella pneumoniae]
MASAEAKVPSLGDVSASGTVTLGGYIDLDLSAEGLFRYQKDGFFPETLSMLDGSSFKLRT